MSIALRLLGLAVLVGAPALASVVLTTSVSGSDPLRFTAVQNSTAPPPSISFTVGRAPSGTALEFHIFEAPDWIVATPVRGMTGKEVNVAANAGNLAPGRYTGRVGIRATGAVPTYVAVELTVNEPPQAVVVSPASVSIRTKADSLTLPEPRQILLLTHGKRLSYTATVPLTATWLKVNGNRIHSGTLALGAPAQPTLTADHTGLLPGTYSTTLLIETPGATPAVTNVSVTLIVEPGDAVIDSIWPNTVAVGNPALTLNVKGRMFAPGLTCSTLPALTPPVTCSYMDEQRLYITLAAGAFTKAGQILLSVKNPGQQKAASATLVVAPPTPVILQVVDAASFRLPSDGENPRLGRGSLFAIIGTSLGPMRGIAPKADSNKTLPLKAGDIEVVVGGIKVPILYAQENQIVAMLPYSSAVGTQFLQVLNSNKASEPMPFEVVDAAPALFTLDSSGSGLVAASNLLSSGGGELHSSSKPARPGTYISLYGTGLGPVNGLDETKLVPRTILPTAFQVEACFDGFGCEIVAAAAAPDNFGGLMQINVRLPDNLPSGFVSAHLVVNGIPSQPGTLVAVAP
jgi:uncharacterized protein (TIGR03437 family)